MNPLPHIISKVTRQPWVITTEKLSAIMNALEVRQSGGFQTLDYPDEDEESSDYDCARSDYREFNSNGHTVAVIPVHGILGKHLSSLEMACGGCSLDTVQNQIKTAMDSPRINSVLMDMNTPGGTVNGTPETAEMIAKLATVKPVWAFTDSDCCSGGMWLASQCSRLYLTQSATIGSIGVRMVLLDFTRQLEEEGVKVNAISSGKYKLMGAPFKPLTEEERDILQTESDRIHADFKKAMNAVRPVEDEFMEGQTFSGEEAVGTNMTDGLVYDLETVLSMMTSRV